MVGSGRTVVSLSSETNRVATARCSTACENCQPATVDPSRLTEISSRHDEWIAGSGLKRPPRQRSLISIAACSCHIAIRPTKPPDIEMTIAIKKGKPATDVPKRILDSANAFGAARKQFGCQQVGDLPSPNAARRINIGKTRRKWLKIFLGRTNPSPAEYRQLPMG